MRKLCLNIIAGLALALSSATLSLAQDSVRSSPKDTTDYSRPAISADIFHPSPSSATGAVNIIRVIDTVVNNTDPTLKNTDTFNDGETTISINPANPNEIVMSAFSGGWGANAPIWHSTDDGQTWTKRFTIPAPPGVSLVGACTVCDQAFDYGRNNVLFGTFLLPDGNVYTGSTTNPASAAAWSWWTIGGNAQRTNSIATSIGNADQPWLLHNRGTTNAAFEDVYVGYDDFGVSPVGTRVSASINLVPPQFPAGSDKFTGSAAGFINPGHRLAQDPRNGWIYSLHQNCITNCATGPANPKTIQYFLNRSIDQGTTWTLNGSATGIVVATADSTQPQPKFGTVNALLGGVLHAGVNPSNGDLYYVYGNRDAVGNNRLAIRRVSDNGAGGVTIGAETFVVSGTVTAALPSVAVTSGGVVGVFYYTFNGIVSGFPQFSTWIATSTDQGATFTSQLLATFLSPAVDNGDARQRVFGDYNQVKTLGDCFYGGFTGNGAAFGRSTANNDPIFFKACVPPPTTINVCGFPRLGDFNADVRGDLIWRQNFSGAVAIWLMNGTSVLTSPQIATVPIDWHISGVIDFNADGRADLVWRHSDGSVAIWLMNGTSIVSSPVIATVPPDWRIAGVGDFNGDGRGDILWRHRDGSVAIWFMNGTSVLSTSVFATVPPDWHILGVGDFNGDGRADIVWRHSTGAVAIWLMNGTTILSGPVIATVPVDWNINTVGDFNADGRADILWRHNDGSVAIWLMDGTTILSGPVIATVPPDWTIRGAVDFNADGRADIAWLHRDGSVAIWLMDGTTIASATVIATVPVDWGIVFSGREPPPNCN